MGIVEYIDRRGTDCAKWDGLKETFGQDGLLPLWVADMDFRIDSHIAGAMKAYIDSGALGYYMKPGSYHEAFIRWEAEEHGLEVKKDWIRFTPGVVTGFHIAVQVMTEPGDAVIVNTPVYYPFLNAIRNNDRKLIECELVNRGGIYTIDFDDFEQKIVDNDVKLFILCSPHNPVGRVWTEDELKRLLDICRRHDVSVISDEIHHDLIFAEKKHIPTLTLAGPEDRILMLTAATKTFNIASVQNSIAVIGNDKLRGDWDAFIRGISLSNGNALGYIATEAAYTHGKPWLNEVRSIIKNNYEVMKSGLTSRFDKISVSPLEGTYLAWIDLGAYVGPEEIETFVKDECGLAVDFGEWFGGAKSGSHIRVNLATSEGNIKEMTARLGKALAAR